MSTRPILFVSHEATRTGGPRVLAELARYLPAIAGRPVIIRSVVSGPMASEFSFLSDPFADAADPAAVVINGTKAAEQLLPYPDRPRLVYAHEQGEALRQLSDGAVAALTSAADRVLAVSESARADLIALGIDSTRVFVLEPPVRTDAVAPLSDDAMVALGLSPSRPLVIACGEAAWRKGPDLFVALASRLRARSDVEFAWIGRRRRPEARRLDYDARVAGVADRIHWLGEQADPRPIIARSSIFVLCSREDPQPLVPLEAAVASVPTVGFTVGGMAEHVASGRALGSPLADVDGLARHVEGLLDDPQARANVADTMRSYASTERAGVIVAERFAAHLAEIQMIEPRGLARDNPLEVTP